MKINLENGRTIEIKADGASPRNRYVHSVTLNGQPWDRAYFRHDDLKDGAVIEFKMKSTPNKRKVYVKPYSLSAE